MSLTILSLLALLTGVLHIRAEYRGSQRAVYILKPLTTTLIFLIALLAPLPVSSFYKATISLGLLFSLLGDIFLMLPADRFIAGLVSFLLAHLWYIVAFTSQSGIHLLSANPVPWLVYGIVILGFLWPHLGKLKIPVLVYMAVILLMGVQAAEQWRQVEQTRAWLALIGAILFIISDSTLALNRFRKPFQSAQALVLSTYYVAQWLIARSIG